jgi:hypothetical protein
MPTKPSIDTLLTRGLGFCCPWAGLEANRKVSSEILGVRLGVSGRAIRYRYDSIACGDLRCERNKTCMKEKLHAREKV